MIAKNEHFTENPGEIRGQKDRYRLGDAAPHQRGHLYEPERAEARTRDSRQENP